ncbi:MAG: hypothetical protein PHI03_10700 [Bacteroidales bacterium]|nr:hypothetical protein [Bacteroidales bacterium]
MVVEGVSYSEFEDGIKVAAENCPVEVIKNTTLPCWIKLTVATNVFLAPHCN